MPNRAVLLTGRLVDASAIGVDHDPSRVILGAMMASITSAASPMRMWPPISQRLAEPERQYE